MLNMHVYDSIDTLREKRLTNRRKDFCSILIIRTKNMLFLQGILEFDMVDIR